LLISNGGLLQIADFGLARPYDESPPQPGKGGGEARREYTALVVTRWYRPPELLLQLKRYTTAIDLWGVGYVFVKRKRYSFLTIFPAVCLARCSKGSLYLWVIATSTKRS
jgi:serine/threonine protein kinase